MIKFCHIAPTPHLEDLTQFNQSHLLLAHLVDPDFNDGKDYDPRYTEFYASLQDGKVRYLDNSAFEMMKHYNGKLYDPNKLIEMGHKVKATHIVLSDYPTEHWTKTCNVAIEQIPQFKKEGFKTFFVPQSEIGDLEGLISSFEWALNNKNIDIIGVSILAIPNAFGIENNKALRSFSRIRFMQILQERGLLDHRAIKRFHFLGAMDNMYELLTLKPFEPYIESSDSSVAIWRGLNFKNFDNSPTGMKEGKFELPVDFNKCFSRSAVKNAIEQIKIWNKTLEWDNAPGVKVC